MRHAPVPIRGLLHISGLALTLVGVALFSAKEGHGFFIFFILRAIYDVDHFPPRTNGLTDTHALGNFFEVALRGIPIAPDFNPNLVVRHRTCANTTIASVGLK